MAGGERGMTGPIPTEQIIAECRDAIAASRALDHPTGPVELLPAGVGPDQPEWHEVRRRGIGASEIAIVMGLSPFESPFSLWWRKREGWQVEVTDAMRTGTRLEPAIAGWWADEHEDLVVVRCGMYAHPDRPWQTASPDRLVHMPCPACDGSGFLCPDCMGTSIGEPAHVVLECKWTSTWDGWGDEGTDDIPIYYRCQVYQQCDVMGVDEWHLAALGPGGFRAYHGRRNERDLALMREYGRRFMASLDAGEQPDIDDGHPATIATLKALHPSIDDIDIEVPVEFAEGYRRARTLRARADALVDRYEARARDMLGDAHRLVVGKKLVVSRSIYDQWSDMAELDSLDTDRATVDKLNPGRAKSYVQ